MINKQLKLYISPDILRQNIDDETVLLNMKSENYFGTNDVGGRVLEILTDGANLETIVKILLQEYDVEKTQLEIDVGELLQQFLDTGIAQKAI